MLLVDKSSTSSNGDESRTPVNVEADNNAKLPVVSSTDKKDLLEMDVDLLKADILRLKGEVACLEKTKFCYRTVSLNEELLPHYTGLPNKGIFNSAHRICQKVPVLILLWMVIYSLHRGSAVHNIGEAALQLQFA